MAVLQKARLFCTDNRDYDFQFLFNPEMLQFQESIKVKDSKSARTDQGTPKVSFEYPKARSTTLNKIMFDTYESGKSVMKEYIEKLQNSVKFQGYSSGGTVVSRPPIYQLCWGDQNYLTCFVEKLDYKLTMFLADGTPVRAEVKLTLKEVDSSFLAANARTYNKDLFGSRDTRQQPAKPLTAAQAREQAVKNAEEAHKRCNQEVADMRREADQMMLLFSGKFNPGEASKLREKADKRAKECEALGKEMEELKKWNS